ncbi:DUF3140 domain-containing protein [Micromonospora sp. BRA006-A]|nr:DUF3140 domain-containing protein [Micromonospora sp. BRA006-A]
MPSETLRQWLLTRGSGGRRSARIRPRPARARPADPRRLRKRKVDLTPEDIEVMREAITRIRELTAQRPRRGNADDEWRHALLDLGHDVLVER